MENIKIGVSVTDITAPLELGILMSSVKQQYEPFESVRMPLKGRILVMEQGSRRVAVVSLELLGISDAAVGGWERFKAAISGIIPPEDIIITCTHTHSSHETAGLTGLCQTAGFRRWLGELEGKLREGLDSAAGDMRKCTMSLGVGSLEGYSLQRRINLCGKIIMSDSIQPIDPKYFLMGPVDRRIKAVRFSSAEGENVATVVNYACHPVHEMCSSHVSPDFPGELCLDIERTEGGMCMFLNGACGDINPPTVSEGAAKAAGHAKAIADRVRGLNWQTVDAAPLKIRRSETAFGIRENSGITSERDGICRIAALTVGGAALIFLSGENFIDTATEIEGGSPFPFTVIAGYSENYVGYIPTERVFREGGYETGPGRWAYLETGAQEKVMKQAVEMLNEMI